MIRRMHLAVGLCLAGMLLHVQVARGQRGDWLEALSVNASLGLQEVSNDIRLGWQAEVLLRSRQLGFGAFTAKTIDDATLGSRLNLRFGGFVLRYEQPVFAGLYVWGDGRLGWGRLDGYSGDAEPEPDIFQDGLHVQELGVGIRLELFGGWSVYSASAYRWARVPRSDQFSVTDLSTLRLDLGLEWAWQWGVSDKSQ
jgi:hypothetical protein